MAGSKLFVREPEMKSVLASIIATTAWAAILCCTGCGRSDTVSPPPRPPRPDASVEFALFEPISMPEPARAHIVEVLSREPNWYDYEEEGVAPAEIGWFIVDGEGYMFLHGALFKEVAPFKGYTWKDDRLREMEATFRRLNGERSNAVAREMLTALESRPMTSASQPAE